MNDMTPAPISVERLRELLDKATPGPWRWEFNATSRSVEIAGGKPTFDKTVMDFTRWGMGRATPRFSGAVTDADGFCILHRLPDRTDWTSPVEGREHHADWFKDVTHPDAALMVAAVNALPALLHQLAERDAEVERLERLEANARKDCEDWYRRYEYQREKLEAAERARGELQAKLDAVLEVGPILSECRWFLVDMHIWPVGTTIAMSAAYSDNNLCP